ncbi:uncharacterized protein J4E88_006279 [Alternaria novae-zelandiae]|uniref:uncharacterized protein n=1 Tax=Alternaria novae-zelandiae TaxID=430562 RepID=UPI0020C57C0D|nr:uncharacterized protein J4E88_006279 [Alternaria novae-zelandiae]KAI4678989.1 hypothetical protein J4E88_006279 [Alternaria novae-zelandiae]
MADPFSITGSAVGVVSLAIQVCKGLEWYLSGVKEAKNKGEQIAAETEELANLLEQLESVIGKVDPSQPVSATRTGIVSCANAIATIRKKLKPDDQAASGGIKSSLKRLTKRLAFPFKEADIKYWKDVLNTIQQSLQTALLALVIDQQRLASEIARLHYTQLSMDQSIHHFSNLQLQRDVFDATSLQLAGQHTCCDIGRIEHEDDPDYSIQPYPRYSPKELRRITNEDAHLRARLEELVPELISQYDSFGGKLQDFVIDVLIPTMRRTVKELKEEDKALYAAGRRELGVIMNEDEEETEGESSEVEEEETDVEEESDDEY